MSVDVEANIASIKNGLTALAQGVPEVMQGFGALGKAVYKDGAISAKLKEMMAVASAIATHCEGCIVWHVRSALRLGMTRAELQEVIGVGIHMGGGPSMVYGIKALETFDHLVAEQANR